MRTILVTLVLLALTAISFAQQAPPAAPAPAPDDTAARLKALEEKILALETEVRAAHREADVGGRELDAARTLVTAAEEQTRIARLEYQAGRGTTYDLVNLEADLAGAPFRETEVRVRIARAATELRRLTTSVPGRTRR